MGIGVILMLVLLLLEFFEFGLFEELFFVGSEDGLFVELYFLVEIVQVI